MLRRAKLLLEKIIRETAALPLRALDRQKCGAVIEQITDGMISNVEFANHRLRFATPTPLLQSRASTLLSKEPDTIRWIETFAVDDVFWDVGANIGTFSIVAAAMRGATVLAFEPAAGTYAMLCRNIELNGLRDKITPYCVALSGETKLGVLNSQSRAAGAALHQFGERGASSRYWPSGNGSCTQGMIGFGIDDFIGRFSPPFPAHMKLDVDGLELDILRGGKATLRDKRLRSVMVELGVSDGEERAAGLSLMTDAGLELAAQGPPQHSAGATAANHLFVRPGGR